MDKFKAVAGKVTAAERMKAAAKRAAEPPPTQSRMNTFGEIQARRTTKKQTKRGGKGRPPRRSE